MTGAGPFRIQKLDIIDFYSKEYLGIKGKNLDGKSLFVYGTNNTGKSTSFDAIIYAIFGREFVDRPISMANTKIALSNGEITIEIERKYNSEPKMKIGKEEIKGSQQVNEKIIELFKIPKRIYNAKMLINALILPQKDEDTLLRKYSQNQLNYILTSFSSGTDCSLRMESIESEIEKLQSLLERFEFEKRDALNEISNLKLIQQKNKNYYYDIKQFLEQYESKEIEKTIEVLERNGEIKQKMGELFSKRTEKYNELFKTGSELNRLRQYYNKELIEIIKQTLAVLVCPICGENLDLNKVDGRKDRNMCPFCGRDHYTGELYKRLNKEISISNEKLSDVLKTESILKLDIKYLDENIKEIKKEKLGIEINPVIFRIIKEMKKQTELEHTYEDYKSSLDKYIHELDESKEKIEGFNECVDRIEKKILTILENVEKLKEERTQIIEEENLKGIYEFNNQLNETFTKLVAPLPYKLNIQNDSIILNTEIVQKNCLDKHALGFSQKKLVDFALWATFQKINMKNNILNINFGLLDDIFENIDNNEFKWKTNLYLIIKDVEENIQLILFSIDKKMNNYLELPNEQNLHLQLNFDSFQRNN